MWDQLLTRGSGQFGKPLRPGCRQAVAQHRLTCRRPPNDVTSITSHIDADRDPAGRAAHHRSVPQQQMKTTPTCLMNSRLRQTLLVEMPPQTRRNVLDINVENIHPVGIVSAGNNTHQLAGVKMPQREHRFRIVGSVTKPVSTGRFLIGTAKEYPIALLDELQSAI